MGRWDLEDIVLFVLGAAFVLFLVVMVVIMVYEGAYCAFGDVGAPRYQYICGYSVDLK